MPQRRKKDGAPPLILVVDDNLDAREMYCMSLRHDGFECVEAANGEDALRIAHARRPALILMDATMPGMDGWMAAELVKGDPDLSATPVVMLTAHAFDEHRKRAEAIGADAFLAKPVLPDEVARVVRRILDGPPVRDARTAL